MTHRGPDAEGVFVGDQAGLAMRRLAVIDVAGGDQPMATPDGRVHVVFNGEIYNYQELRRYLEARGYEFRTHSDTEVIPYLYRELGMEFLGKLNGMFAIALWDADASSLLLARDRVGIKPLYYSVVAGELFFGSEVKCILAANGSARELDLVALDQYFSLEYTASPRTLLADVKKLAPGGWLRWARGRVSLGTFWMVPDEVQMLREPDAAVAERVRGTLISAVKRQMISDVPLGGFLSGGIDSSILVSAMARAGNGVPKTFSVGFGESSYSELDYARLVAERFHTDHHEENLQPNFLETLPSMVAHLDQPIADFSVFPTLLVSKMARKHVTVALSGDGGDELFFGYDTYLADVYARRSLDHLPASMRRAVLAAWQHFPITARKKGLANSARRFLEGAALDSAWQHMRWMIFLPETLKRRLYSPAFYEHIEGKLASTLADYFDNGGYDRRSNQMVCDLRLYLTENILPKVDLMSMAVSLEARVPYLDNEMIDLALRIPSDQKYRRGVRKFILKEAFKADLPPELMKRGKEGFSMPMKNWLNAEWNELMHDLLSPSEIRRTGLFRPEGIAGLIREHEQNRHNHSHILWALMLFQLWSATFLAPGQSAASNIQGAVAEPRAYRG